MGQVAHELGSITQRQSQVVPCDTGNTYNGGLGIRISSVFVILIGSFIGSFSPIISYRRSKHVEYFINCNLVRSGRFSSLITWDFVFFVSKYFGYGVIISTAFIHLLAPANAALNNLCLTGPITEYDWVEGIALMTVFTFFSIHFSALQRRPESRDQVNGNANPNPNGNIPLNNRQSPPRLGDGAQPRSPLSSYYPVELLSVLILEFGILFHSVFIGLTLAVAGDEFSKLYVVIVFHQFFEGVGLGSRLEKNLGDHKRTKYVMALMYTFITPIAISIGLGVRASYQPGSQRALVVNGICDSISAGILIYTGLVDLMANEFLYGTVKPVYPIPAFASMCLGAFLMALLGEWA